MPSSVIRTFQYFPNQSVLRIVYNSGAVYDYLEVSSEVYAEFCSAFSKGFYLNKFIKPRFGYRKVSDANL